MDVRSPFFQNIATLLIGVLFLNPIVSTAAELAVDAAAGGNTGIAAAGNGVPVVNIATPNGNGLSHNTFRDYNVGQQGLILNNSAQALVQSQLGGYIVGNSNLKNGAANVILNEVTGSNQSRLNGYTEVAGQSAHVIVANPNGISCDGCGFINTPRATLTTGKPIIEKGRLDRFDVDGGEIAIEGEGLNASNLDQFDLITRSATLNASLYANQLNVITGRNEVRADDLATTAKADDGSSKPQLAIDSSALGGMYAGAIRLVGTEAGVGVRLAGDMAASAGDIQIDANGHLSLAKAAAARDITIDAQSAELGAGAYAGRNAVVNSVGAVSVIQSLAASGEVAIQASQLNNQGVIEAGVNADNSRNATGDLDVKAQTVANSGALKASRNASIDATTAVDNRAGGISGGASTHITTATLDNREGGVIVSQGALDVHAGSLDNRGGALSGDQSLSLVAGHVDNRDTGLITSQADMTVSATSLDSSNDGELSAKGDLDVAVGTLTQQGGRLIGESAVTIDLQGGDLDNRSGLISAGGTVTLQNGGNLINRDGEISALQTITLNANSLDNSLAGVLLGNGQLSLDIGQIDNSGEGVISGIRGVIIRGTSVDNSAGGTLSSSQGGLNIALSGALDNHTGGALVSRDALSISGQSLDNSGQGIVSSDADVSLELAGALSNQTGGLVTSGGTLQLRAGTVDNRAGTIASASSLTLTSDSMANGAGQMSSVADLTLTLTNDLDNENGTLSGGGPLLINATAVNNASGKILGQGLLQLFADSLANTNGAVAARHALSVRVSGALDNTSGQIYSLDDGVELTAKSLTNDSGTLQGKGDLTLTVDNALSSQNGRAVSETGKLSITAASLDNHDGILESLQGLLKVALAGLFDNSDGITQAESLDLSSGDLNNSQGHLSAVAGNAVVVAANLDNQDGGLYARDALDVRADAFDNRAGTLGAVAITLDLSGALDNQSGLIESASTLDLSAGSVQNAEGKLRALGSAGRSDFIIGGLFDNDAGLVEIGNANFGLTSAALNNSGGTVRHVGTQAFALSLADAGQAGGSFITNGALNLTVADWSNSSVLQAQSINLSVEHFTQAASGKLIAVGDIVASGNAWQNDGAIEAGGNLNLHLVGTYSGDGSLLAQSNLNLTAASAALGEQAQLRSGLDSSYEIAGLLQNHGQITAGNDLEVNATNLENYGTLGAAGFLATNSTSLRNETGLMFSGADMALTTDSFVNLYGDVYSLGKLQLAKDASGAQADLLENRSGSIVSSGDMTLRAAVISNRKEVFSLDKVQNYGVISVTCYDCGGDHHNVDYVATERFDTTVKEDSAAASITAGGDLEIQGGAIANNYSSIVASGNISIAGSSLENIGAATGTAERVRRFNTGRINDGEDERFRAAYVYPYNSAALPKEIPDALSRWSLVSDIETVTATGIGAVAVIQAGGNVNVQATQSLANATVLENQASQTVTAPSVDTSVSQSATPLVVRLNAQLPADLAQQAVDPLTLSSFSLPQGQNGLFRLTDQNANGTQTGEAGSVIGQAQAQSSGSSAGSPKYLIETNPAFANLKNFLSSDYMLGLLGIDPDETQKRLGDGLYEQHLIQDAIVARTGKRYLDGLASDEAQFKYLMDNAIASKEALNLSVGVALTAEQVAALTHDIVWMQEEQVNGEAVLVPVLYLAQANDRLAPSGALIQGQDVALISGSDLTNSGTLRATNNLTATATNLSNAGLMQANERISLLATESIRNAQGGIINGKNVSAIALIGDVSNERTITQQNRTGKDFSQLTSVVDSGARIEAANDLTLSAGRNIQNIGSSITAGGRLDLSAGNDVVIASAEADDGMMRKDKRHFWSKTSTTQYGSEVQAGGSISATADNDLSVIASNVKASGDIGLSAGRDISVTASANESSSEYRYKRSDKKVEKKNSEIIQQASSIESGGDLTVQADNDLTVVASNLNAANDVSLDAGRDTNILSAQNENASYYFKSKKGSFGRSKSEQKESYDSGNVASVVEAGHDLTVNASTATGGSLNINGGRDVSVIGSQLNAGNDLLVGATGDVAILSGVEEHGSYSKKTKSGFLGLSKSGKSQLKTSATQIASELEAGNDVVIAAGNDIRLRASETTAGNDVELQAGLVNDTGDINLVSANDEAYSRSESYKKKFGLSASDATGLAVGTPSWGGDIAIFSAKKSGQEIIRSTNVGSQVNAARDASLIAERDINVVGSGVNAGRNVLLDAGRDVNVAAGSSNEQVTSWKNTKTVGLQQDFDRNGFTTFVGEEKLKDKLIDSQQTAAGSQINAGLDVDIRAGRDIVQQGSDLNAGYDLNLQAGRNIVVDAAAEQSLSVREQSQERTGTTTTVNHNFGNTMDALSGAGKGDNSVSQASSILRATDSVSQFLSGPTFDAHIGSTGQSQRVTQMVQGSRVSTQSAGNDINLLAQNDVTVRGGQFSAGRDINVAGQDVTFDVARGEQRFDNQQSQSKGGIVGGTTGGFKVGVGGGSGTATQRGNQGTSSGAQLEAQRDVNFSASHDLSLVGTQVQAGRDIDLHAGNDLSISAAANAASNEDRRHSGGGEVGLTFGSDGIGVYASVDVGRGQLVRDSTRQQEAYLYAGRDLDFEAGRDASVSGAKLEGENVDGEVGRNLTVSSVPDTGKVSGKEFDASATVTIGYGASVSGSVGYGQTTGETHWVGNQTSITARDRLDIRTEEHTQIDGAVIASQTGNLKLDTDTLGFRDIEGEDKEHSYYLNAGGSYGSGQQDKSQSGKGESGENGWSVSGYEYEKEREQIVRATVGAGEIVVRGDGETGHDSTTGLNRDTSKAYEITKDKEERTDLYVSKSSLEAVSDPKATFQQWVKAVDSYGDSGEEALANVGKLIAAASSFAEGRTIDEIQLQQQGIEALRQIDKAVKQLSKGDKEQRAAAADFLMSLISGGAETAQSQAVAANISTLAEQNPESAVRALVLLAAFQGTQNPAQQNLGPLLLGIPIYEALGAALLVGAGAAATPAGQESLAAAANAVMEASGKVAADMQEQLRLSAELWGLIVGTSFPIYTLDPKYGPLVNPIVDFNEENPASGGYAEGVRVITIPHTGGSQLDGQQGGTSYTTPEHQLNPGGMYSEQDKATGSFNSKEVAANLGYSTRIPPQKAPFNSHGQSVFFNGKQYITPDVDSHNVTNGWKSFDLRGRRTGTWNSDLTQRIKD